MTTTETETEAVGRESTTFWFKMIDASAKRRSEVNALAAMFMRWHAGDLHDLVDPKATQGGERWRSGLDNQHALAVTAAMADVFFRCPRPVVRTPYVPRRPPPPIPGMPPAPPPPATTLFSPDLARCEEEMLRQEIQFANYFEKARRSLQDAFNADMGVLKITHDAETTIDQEERDAATLEAQQELAALLAGNLKACWAQEGQIHSIHMEIKGQELARAERGESTLDSTGKRYLRNHIRIHAAMKGEESPTESIRANSIRVERINPLDYYYDPTASSRDDRTWVACRFMRRRDSVLADESYDEAARLEMKSCQDRWEQRPHMPAVDTTGSFDLPEEMVMLFEVFDLVDQKRILMADGATIPLKIEPRGDLAILQPSGPFHELVFVEDSMEGQGVPPPVTYAAEAAAATHIAASEVAAAIQNQPRTIYDPRRLPTDQVARAWAAPVGTASPIEWKGELDGKVDDAWGQVPAAEIHESSAMVKQQCDQGVMMRSGLGVAKMMGGEQAPTATGAALGADASGSISEDRGAKIDAWSRRHFQHFVRLIRRFTPKSMWIQRCGDVAIVAVPDRFSALDSANDVGVDCIPGSARRRNTNVDQEQLLKGLQVLAPLPAMQGPAGQRLVLDIARQFLEDGGSTGLQWEEVYQEVEMAALMQQQAAMGAGTGGDVSGAPVREDRSGENQGVAQNDLEQGVQNAAGGGGRVGVNETVGQSVVRNREAAQKRVVGRG